MLKCAFVSVQLELHRTPALAKRWRALERRQAKESKAAESSGAVYTPLAQRPDATFLPSLLDEFLEVTRTLKCSTISLSVDFY